MNASAYFKRRAAMASNFRDHYGGSRPFNPHEFAAQNHLLEEQAKSEAREAAVKAEAARAEANLRAEIEAKERAEAEAAAKAAAEAEAKAAKELKEAEEAAAASA